jgi:hypothetical protein
MTDYLLLYRHGDPAWKDRSPDQIREIMVARAFDLQRDERTLVFRGRALHRLRKIAAGRLGRADPRVQIREYRSDAVAVPERRILAQRLRAIAGMLRPHNLFGPLEIEGRRVAAEAVNAWEAPVDIDMS